MNRREFIKASASAVPTVTAMLSMANTACAKTQAATPITKRRRIIVNRDAGAPREWDNGRDDYVKRNLAMVEGEQVDTAFWCFDEGTTAGYESKVRELQRCWDTDKTSEGLAKVIAEGNDPPKVVVEEAHKRGREIFYSFRINGHEDSYLPAEVPEFKKKHPEYTLKGHVSDQVWAALNFAIPEVRKQRLDVIAEVLEKYDFDGIEIDWLRSPYYFYQHHEFRLRYLLTDMMRTFRRMVDDRSKQIGRRLTLAVRVDETIESCLLDGLDVETWAREGLMDILALGSGATYCDIPKFRQITKGTDIAIYPCIYRYGHDSFYEKPYPPEIVRGIAANYWFNQPDGIYTFNWGPEPELYKQIGSPETLTGKDKMFIAYVRNYHSWPDPYYPHNMIFSPLPVELRQVNADTPLIVPLHIADDVADAARAGKLAEVKLRVAVEQASDNDKITVKLNGRELSIKSFDSSPGDFAKTDFACRSMVFYPDPKLCTKGNNEVSLYLVKPASDSEKPIVVHAVDMLVRYKT
jgi:hypothetical protein